MMYKVEVRNRYLNETIFSGKATTNGVSSILFRYTSHSTSELVMLVNPIATSGKMHVTSAGHEIDVWVIDENEGDDND